MNLTAFVFSPSSSSSNYELVRFLVSVGAPIVSGYLGIKYGLKQIKVQKRIDMLENQLNKFYSPLLGLHKEIDARSQLRVKISKLGNEAWQESCEIWRASSALPDITPYSKEIEFNNRQLREVFLPQFNRMLDIFRDNYWLAELETREFYPILVEFVEVFNRYFNDGLPPEVAIKIKHDEGNLKPFYEDLEKRTNILRKELLKIK